MLDIRSKEECCGCSACSNICPKQCITMQANDEGFWYPNIKTDSCVYCGMCKRVCPIINSAGVNNCDIPMAYAAVNKNEKVRLNSSSGGIFTLLAEEVIKQKGIVIGAAMSEGCYKVHHISIEKVEELDKLQGSKYSQSWIGNTFLEVKKQLDNDRMVLFSGTPCQVEGLRNFLNRDYENLLSMDFICHGVPSPKIWNKYVVFREKSAGSPVQRIFFRHKKNGWRTFTVLFEYSNKTVYEQIFSKDLYMQSFLRNSCLRPSCHNCKFKKLNRVSDITMADFWGIHNIAPEMDDDKGTSLILVHSEKGHKVFEKMKYFAEIVPVNTLLAIKENSAMIRSAVPNKNRTKFFKNINKMEFDELVARYAKQNYSIRKSVVDILRKIGVTNVIKHVLNRK